jgi:DNA-binding protein
MAAHQAVVVAVPLVVFVLVDRALAARVARKALGVEIARAVDDVIIVEDRRPDDWLSSAKPA